MLVTEIENRLTLVKIFEQRNKHKQKVGLFSCKCGNETKVILSLVKNNKVRSCGCISKEIIIKRNTKHNKTYSKEYNSWCAMKGRCTNPKNSRYKYYGERGITVCYRWLESFENFYKDMGPKPSKQHSIERRENNGNYYKENCFWATKQEQSNNTRRNNCVQIDGNKMSVAQISRKYNISKATILKRIRKNLPPEKITEKPIKKGGRKCLLK